MKGIISRYGLIGTFKLFIDVVFSYFYFEDVRVIRRPFYIRGKKHIYFGKNLTSGVGLRVDAFPRKPSEKKCIEFGDNIELNDYVHIAAINSVVIQDNVLIASKVFISDHDHGIYRGNNQSDPNSNPKQRILVSEKIVIESNVWIGEFVSILKGVTIGKGSIIGCNSVVTRDIPPYCIAVGAPAVIIKRYNFKTNKWEISNQNV